MNYELLTNYRQRFINAVKGRSWIFNVSNETANKETIIAHLNEYEQWLEFYDKISGFRNLPDYFFANDEILKRSAFIWADPSDAIKIKIEEVKDRGGVVFDIRQNESYEKLSDFFNSEYSKLKNILLHSMESKDTFSIQEPFQKCLCFHCMLIGKPMVDLFFTSDLFGRTKNIEIVQQLVIGGKEEDLAYNKVIANKKLNFRNYGVVVEKKVKPKPSGYYERENHSLFIMGYIHFYLLFETYPQDKHVLRKRLKKCNYCYDFYIKKTTHDSVKKCCGRPECNGKRVNEYK